MRPHASKLSERPLCLSLGILEVSGEDIQCYMSAYVVLNLPHQAGEARKDDEATDVLGLCRSVVPTHRLQDFMMTRAN